jgi:beta-glucanase (GH16 family)
MTEHAADRNERATARGWPGARRAVMRCRLLFGVIMLGAATTTPNAPPQPVVHPPISATLTFDEEFNGFRAAPDGTARWTTVGGNGWRTLPANHEAEFYSDSTVGANPFATAHGGLTITAAPGPNAAGLPYVSGIITTAHSFSQLYGYFEVRARLPAGRGLWPAIWLLPSDHSWPPELDIMEMLGSDPSVIFVGTHSIVGNHVAATTTRVDVGDTTDDFHLYAVNWTAQTITWYFDGRPIFREPTPADLHRPMYLLINLAVGGVGSWPGPPEADTPFPARLRISYVRIFSHQTDGK